MVEINGGNGRPQSESPFQYLENNAVTFLEKILSYGPMIAAKMRQRRGRTKFHGARNGG